jgi:methylated-DNA-[protein]-cysteine S-methyltransferase
MPHLPPSALLVENIPTPLGALLLTHDGKALWNIAFADREERRQGELALHAPDAAIRSTSKRSHFGKALIAYFRGDLAAIEDLAVADMGTPFQRKAWRALRRVPAGVTRSYGELAARIGHAGAARAVGHANGQNPVSIVVPCHRLVGSDGALVRYGGGIERKRWLIDHEARWAGKV